VVQTLKGKIEADKALEALKGWKFNSPRGPIMIDPVTRDIVMSYVKLHDPITAALVDSGRPRVRVIGTPMRAQAE